MLARNLDLTLPEKCSELIIRCLELEIFNWKDEVLIVLVLSKTSTLLFNILSYRHHMIKSEHISKEPSPDYETTAYLALYLICFFFKTIPKTLFYAFHFIFEDHYSRVHDDSIS